MHKSLAMILFGFLLLGGDRGDAQPLPQQLSLTLSQAVELALRNNLATRLAEERAAESRGERGLSLSALLPSLSGVAYQMNLTENLAAMGLPAGKFPGLAAMVGPFNRFDARFQLLQNVLDLAVIRRYQAAGRAVAMAGDRQRLAAQQVTAAATLAYLAVLEAGQAVVTAQTVLEGARQVRISSLAQFNVARLNLVSALGHAEDFRL